MFVYKDILDNSGEATTSENEIESPLKSNKKTTKEKDKDSDKQFGLSYL